MQKIYTFILTLMLGLISYESTYATEDDKPSQTKGTLPIATKGEIDPKTLDLSSQLQYKKASLEAQAELSKAMQGINVSSVEKIIQKDYMMDVTERMSAAVVDSRSQARGLFQYLDSKGLYKEGDLQYDDLMTLPIGLKKTLGNSTAEVGILKAAFYSDYAEMTVFVRLKINVPGLDGSAAKEREVFFGVDKIKFSKAGGIQAFKAVLLGDFIIPMGKWTLKLKGGLDIATGNINYTDATYCSVECGNFQKAQLSAEVIFPRDVLIPLHPTTYALSTSETDRVTGSFKAEIENGLNDLSAKVDFDKPFSAAGFTAIGFILKRAELDLSDTRNDGIIFPPADGPNSKKYDLSKYELSVPGSTDGAKSVTSWKGLYVAQFGIILPSEFKDKSVTHVSGRKVIDVKDFIFDATGISGKFGISGTAANPVIATKNGSASGWGFALYDFHITLMQNKVTAGDFKGDIRIPLAPKDKFEYSGEFHSNGDFIASVAAKGSYPLRFDSFRAKATIVNPVFTLERSNGVFRPYAKLNGTLSIGTNISGSTDETGNTDAAVSMADISFQNLELQTVSPYIKMDPVEIKTNQKLAGFPVSLSEFGISQPSSDKAVVSLGLSLSLMADKLSGSTAGDFNLNYVTNGSEGGGEWQLESFKLRKIRIKGDIGTSVNIAGEVDVYETSQRKGFKGQLNIGIHGGTLNINGAACAEFGYQKENNYHYWNVQLAAQFSQALPLAGPFAVNGASIGVYHHMKAEYTPGGRASVCSIGPETVQYNPDKDINLGVKGVLGLEAGGKLAFNGFAGLEFIIGESYGLQYVSLFGEGTIAGGFKVPGPINYMNEQMGKIIQNASELTPEIRAASEGKKLNNETVEMMNDMVDTKAKSQYGGINQTSTGGTLNGAIYAKVAMIMDLQEGYFKANANLDVKVGDIITGHGTLEVHVGHNIAKANKPEEWWVYVGRPEKGKRLSLDVDFNFGKSTASGYFMLGYNIPDLPCPEQDGIVYKSFKDKLNCDNDGFYKRSCESKDDLQNTGSGMALGIETAFHAGFDLGVYGIVNGQVGFDVNVKEYGARRFCGQGLGENDLGIKRWYAMGQVYGAVQVELGIHAFVRIKLASGTAAAMVQVGLPNPTWVRGLLKLQGSLLGIIDVGIEPEISIGDVCPEIAGTEQCN